ncbi:MAG: histidine--tRNA ligase [Bacteroidetes bacterium]|nr:histidine--tRNA ligase [Bacteroidota bacterium]
MATKPSIPKGTRDFTPIEMSRRNYIFDTIREVFKLFGFQQIETPSFENLSTLTGKYGDEGDRLIFKILNSGDFLQGVDNLNNTTAASLVPVICEKALRYDLTVPFARYVVQYQNDIVFPFRRFQIQPVWRADRPQKGRYREFYQCDVDIIGSESMLNEAELVQIVDQVFEKLGISVNVMINNRKILAALADAVGASDNMTDITVAIDKLDKIGSEKMAAELLEKGLSPESVSLILEFTQIEGNFGEKMDSMKQMLGENEIGERGILEMSKLFGYLKHMELKCGYMPDFSLARGLNYYTGAIFEVKAKDAAMGSLCGGGRYDDLTGIFGLPGVSGVGISFGADRIYDLMSELKLFPAEIEQGTQVLFVNFGEMEEQFCIPIAKKLREIGVRTEIFPESAKMKKQMGYADKNNIQYVVIAGENEVAQNKVTLKNMRSGEQNVLTIEELLNVF